MYYLLPFVFTYYLLSVADDLFQPEWRHEFFPSQIFLTRFVFTYYLLLVADDLLNIRYYFVLPLSLSLSLARARAHALSPWQVEDLTVKKYSLRVKNSLRRWKI